MAVEQKFLKDDECSDGRQTGRWAHKAGGGDTDVAWGAETPWESDISGGLQARTGN